MHELARAIPVVVFALMIVIPLLMAAAAIALGWYARNASRRHRVEGAPRGMGEDALGAGITVAVVPGGFALMMLWARFG